MELIPQWRSSWRFTSLQAGWVLGFFDAMYAADSFGLQATLGPQWFGVLNAAVVSILLPWLRNVQQSPPLTNEVKKEIVENLKDSPTKTPSGVVDPPPPHKTTREELDAMMDARILAHEKLKARRPRKPRKKSAATSELTAAFAVPGASSVSKP